MPKRKFSIIDENGENHGFVVIETAPTFQHIEPATLAYSETISDAFLFVTVLGGFTSVAWLIPGPVWFAPAVGISITAALAGIKAWRGSLLPAEGPEAPEPNVLIKGEFHALDERTVYIDEITDKDIRYSNLKRLCEAVANNIDPQTKEMIWLGRPSARLKAGVKRTQYERIRAEFQRLNYLMDGENGKTVVGSRGRLFVRRVAALPYRRSP